jgi:hypothetical protein
MSYLEYPKKITNINYFKKYLINNIPQYTLIDVRSDIISNGINALSTLKISFSEENIDQSIVDPFVVSYVDPELDNTIVIKKIISNKITISPTKGSYKLIAGYTYLGTINEQQPTILRIVSNKNSSLEEANYCIRVFDSDNKVTLLEKTDLDNTELKENLLDFTDVFPEQKSYIEIHVKTPSDISVNVASIDLLKR